MRGERERRSGARSTAAAIVFFAAAAVPGVAQEPKFFVGLRGNIVGSDGEPTNDMLGAGLTGRLRWNERWSLGLALDHSPGFDVERPYEKLGLAGAEVDDEVVDAEATSTSLSGWIERVYTREGRRLEWFWGAGAGFATVDVEDATGPLVAGGTFDIHQEVGTELIALGAGGLRVRLGDRWRLEFAARLEQHFTDWELTDRVSGRTAEYDDYLVKGVHIGIQIGF
jgi:hypothetical protein